MDERKRNHDIGNPGNQEKTNKKEARKEYTWFTSGEQKNNKDQEYTAGVGFVINNRV